MLRLHMNLINTADALVYMPVLFTGVTTDVLK